MLKHVDADDDFYFDRITQILFKSMLSLAHEARYSAAVAHRRP